MQTTNAISDGKTLASVLTQEDRDRIGDSQLRAVGEERVKDEEGIMAG